MRNSNQEPFPATHNCSRQLLMFDAPSISSVFTCSFSARYPTPLHYPIPSPSMSLTFCLKDFFKGYNRILLSSDARSPKMLRI